MQRLIRVLLLYFTLLVTLPHWSEVKIWPSNFAAGYLKIWKYIQFEGLKVVYKIEQVVWGDVTNHIPREQVAGEQRVFNSQTEDYGVIVASNREMAC